MTKCINNKLKYKYKRGGGENRHMKLDEKAKEARREYYRNYYRKNKEKIRLINLNYWKKKAMEKELNENGEKCSSKSS